MGESDNDDVSYRQKKAIGHPESYSSVKVRIQKTIRSWVYRIQINIKNDSIPCTVIPSSPPAQAILLVISQSVSSIFLLFLRGQFLNLGSVLCWILQMLS